MQNTEYRKYLNPNHRGVSNTLWNFYSHTVLSRFIIKGVWTVTSSSERFCSAAWIPSLAIPMQTLPHWDWFMWCRAMVLPCGFCGGNAIFGVAVTVPPLLDASDGEGACPCRGRGWGGGGWWPLTLPWGKDSWWNVVVGLDPAMVQL